MAKYLTIVDFGEAGLVSEAAHLTGFSVHAGKPWWSQEDGVNKVAIYTDTPEADHTPLFETFERLKASAAPSVQETVEPAAAVNDDRQIVRGHVISGDEITVVKTGPIKLDANGRAVAEIVFDRPITVPIPLEALIPDPQERDDLMEALENIFESESSRLDDLVDAGGMDPTWCFIGGDLSGTHLVGTPDRPIDLRGWNLSRCDLTGSVFEHVLVDETTILDDAILDGITGSDADTILALAFGSSPRP